MRMHSTGLLCGLTLGLLSTGGCPMTTGGDDPTATQVTLGSTFVQTERTGTATATTEFNATCQGFFPTTAQHTLTVDVSQAMTISVSGSDNAVVRVLAGASNFCVSANDPLMRFWTRGDAEIFVGSTVEGETFNYELTFTGSQ